MGRGIDVLIRHNLGRLISARGLTQVEAARTIGTSPQYLNAMLRGDRGVGYDLMTRICREFKAEPWELFVAADTPVVKDQGEVLKLRLYREEERLGIAQDVIEQEEIWIERARRKIASGAELKDAVRERGLRQKIDGLAQPQKQKRTA